MPLDRPHGDNKDATAAPNEGKGNNSNATLWDILEQDPHQFLPLNRGFSGSEVLPELNLYFNRIFLNEQNSDFVAGRAESQVGNAPKFPLGPVNLHDISSFADVSHAKTVLGPSGTYELTRNADGSYRMKLETGYRFNDAAAEAIRQASGRNAEFSFVLNGIEVKATATSTVAEMTRFYKDESKRRREEYQKSPEGIKAAEEQAASIAKEEATRSELELQYGRFFDRPDLANLKFTPSNSEGFAALVNDADAGNLSGYGKETDYCIINHARVVASELQKIVDRDGAAALTPDYINKLFDETDVVGHSGFSENMAWQIAVATAREDVGRAILKASEGKTNYDDFVKGFDTEYGGTRSQRAGGDTTEVDYEAKSGFGSGAPLAVSDSLGPVAKADIHRTVDDFARNSGIYAADQASFSKPNDSGLSLNRIKGLRAQLHADDPAGGGKVMKSLGKIGLASGLVAALSTAVYLAQKSRQSNVSELKIPVFSAD